MGMRLYGQCIVMLGTLKGLLMKMGVQYQRRIFLEGHIRRSNFVVF